MRNETNPNIPCTSCPMQCDLLGAAPKEKEQPSDPTETAQGFVAGLHPGDPLQLLFEDECEDFLPCFGEDESIQELPGIRVLMSFDDNDVLTIGEIRLLLGPALFYNVDEEGELLPLSPKELYQIKIFMQYLTVTVHFTGQEHFALLLC